MKLMGVQRPSAFGGFGRSPCLLSLVLREGDAGEGDAGLGGDAEAGGVAGGEAGGEVFDVFFVAGGVVGGVGDEHGHLDDAVEVAAGVGEDGADYREGVADFFLGGVAAVDAVRGVVWGAVAGDEDEVAGAGGAAEGAGVGFGGVDEFDHRFGLRALRVAWVGRCC